ncbi:ABC transporter permease [Pseudochryseolinea flava]|uniref:MacB-like periplasmic core domain-containing protein n=1 Tax=Pseudochryseolinea flava TaxID=2059302 RepID=A0A364Y0K4_9BACT|nr:ABC transporter permease [Pseudochryseolinea flava]RAW00185.1 hypothetical protein DQQ10_16700 [Pseudochryseolinea flava]
MIKNYFIVALRQIIRNKSYSIINIGGLAIGLACCITIGIYIHHELSYDRFHSSNHIYRVTEVQEQADDLYAVAVTPGVLAKQLKDDFPVVEQTCRIGMYWQAPVFSVDEKSVESGRILITDNGFFSIFNFPLLYGDTTSALLNPDDVVLTEKMAIAMFGPDWKNKNVIGKEIVLNQNRTLTIVAIARNPPENSHLQFEALLSMKHEEKSSSNFGWNSNNFHTYITLDPNANVSALEKSIFRYLDNFDKEKKTSLHLQPVEDIYLHSNFDFHTDWSSTVAFYTLKSSLP